MTDAERWLEVAVSMEGEIERINKSVAIYRRNAETGIPWNGVTEEDEGCISGTATHTHRA